MSTINRFKFKFGDLSRSLNKDSNLVRFIHASDTHLGIHQYRNEFRADDFIRAFEQILVHGIANKVDFILLAGDIFTSLEMLPGKLTDIMKMLIEFKEYANSSILLIAIEGNHDIRKFSKGVRFEKRGQSWLKLLSSLGLIILLDADLEADYKRIFETYNFTTKKGGKIQIKNVVIYGTGYLGEQPISQLSKLRKAIRKSEGTFNILIQHFGIEGQMENVPGVKLEDIQPLRHRVDYLALGHFHKQFILEDWIYNPGSSEAVCSIDNSFKRGIFLVEISEESGKFIKEIKMIRLVNRNFVWKTIYFNHEIRNKKDFETLIVTKLSHSLIHLNYEKDKFNPKVPVLYLILKGRKPSYSFKVNEKDLKTKICEILPVVDVKVYQKFGNSLRTLDNYLLEEKSMV